MGRDELLVTLKMLNIQYNVYNNLDIIIWIKRINNEKHVIEKLLDLYKIENVCKYEHKTVRGIIIKF